MKFILSATILLFSSSVFAQDLSGTWTITQRACGDGSATMDRFLIGEDKEAWTFDPVRSEFRYELTYMNGLVEAAGTYTRSQYDEGSFRLKLKTVSASPNMWEREWETRMREFGIQLSFISESEVAIDAQLPPFQNSCWSGIGLVGKFKRQ